MRLSLAFHIIGLVMWLGGLMIITRIMKVLCQGFSAEAEPGMAGLRAMVKRVYFAFILPGALISLTTGIIQILNSGMKYYMTQGWFHAKLTLVLVLFAVTVVVGSEVLKAARAVVLSPKRLIALHIVSASSLILIVVMTVLGR